MPRWGGTARCAAGVDMEQRRSRAGALFLALLTLSTPLTAAPLALAETTMDTSSDTPGDTTAEPFSVWLDGVRRDALERGIAASVIDEAFDGLEPLPHLLEKDRSQPEFLSSFWNYLDRRVTEQRIRRGREQLATHRAALTRARLETGVPERILAALWGLESDYGAQVGTTPVIAALATLAYNQRRAAFFRGQLLDALMVAERERLPPRHLLGSWAGAMGPFQFMPGTFLHYARDGDGDGRIDPWNSIADGTASAAAYLRAAGWRPGETWGREVRLPPGFDPTLAQPGVRRPLAAWARSGLRAADGKPLPKATIDATLLLPSGVEGPAFLVYDNFGVLMRWNRSTSYALTVGHLADRLAGAPPLAAPRRGEAPIPRARLAALQWALTSAGYAAGADDGVLGPATRRALSAWQADNGLPPDGYPTPATLDRLTPPLPTMPTPSTTRNGEGSS